jgi:hypothetical protein
MFSHVSQVTQVTHVYPCYPSYHAFMLPCSHPSYLAVDNANLASSKVSWRLLGLQVKLPMKISIDYLLMICEICCAAGLDELPKECSNLASSQHPETILRIRGSACHVEIRVLVWLEGWVGKLPASSQPIKPEPADATKTALSFLSYDTSDLAMRCTSEAQTD